MQTRKIHIKSWYSESDQIEMVFMCIVIEISMKVREISSILQDTL